MLDFRPHDYTPADYRVMCDAVGEMFGALSKECTGLCYKCKYGRACKDIRELLFTVSNMHQSTSRLQEPSV